MMKRFLVYCVGLAIGSLAGLLVSYLTGKYNLVSVISCGNLGGVLALACAQYWGLVPSPEEASRPLSLFASGAEHGRRPK